MPVGQKNVNQTKISKCYTGLCSVINKTNKRKKSLFQHMASNAKRRAIGAILPSVHPPLCLGSR